MISEEWRSELLSKVNIADIVGEHVTLVNKGGRLWACCPFHNEKTPSFTVNTDRQFYHCFGCGKGGNVINFVMEIEKLNYVEACQYLADKVKMPMPQKENHTHYAEFREQREKIQKMNRIAARVFYENLKSEEGKEARQYLRGRGINDAVIKTFGLGFAPDGWDYLLRLLKEQGYTQKDAIEAGLAKTGGGKVYDAFRNRVMMPIINNFSEVIGFGGRVMDKSEPKYLNSPETAAFNKRKNLYNLNLVRKIKNLQYVVLVEGYMDAIALYMYGIKNVVATLGTALTAEQARLIKRYVSGVVVSYDGDEAGQKATARALDILAGAGLDVRVISMPGGLDPDEYLKKYKKDGFIQLVSAALPALDYKMARLKDNLGKKAGYGMEQYAKECAALLKKVESPIIREKYVRKLAEESGFSEAAIYEEIGVKKVPDTSGWEKLPENVSKENRPRSEQYVLARLLSNPACAQELSGRIAEEDFEDPVHKKIFSAVLKKINKGFTPTDAEIISELSDGAETSRATELLSREDDLTGAGKSADDYMTDCVRDMQVRKLVRMRAHLLQKYGEEKDDERKNELLNDINKLSKEIHEKKERLN